MSADAKTRRALVLAEQALWRALSEAEQAEKHAARAGVRLRFNNIQHAIDIERHVVLNAIESKEKPE